MFLHTVYANLLTCLMQKKLDCGVMSNLIRFPLRNIFI